MTIITGYGDLLRTALEDNPPLQEKVEEIMRAGEQANSLTRQLLAFTRRQMLQPSLLDLNACSPIWEHSPAGRCSSPGCWT